MDIAQWDVQRVGYCLITQPCFKTLYNFIRCYLITNVPYQTFDNFIENSSICAEIKTPHRFIVFAN